MEKHRMQYNGRWMNIFTFWRIFIVVLTFSELTKGCILLLNGWQPLPAPKRAALADIVVSAIARRTFKDVRTEADTYSAEFYVFTVLKGHKLMKKIPNNSLHPNIYNVSNFGDKPMCYADVNSGNSYILFLTTFNGGLSAKYDDVFGATIDYSFDLESKTLESLGWKPWAEWTSCSATCGGGIQTRQRECTKKNRKKCDGTFAEQRKCNSFRCRDVVNLLTVLHNHILPEGVSSLPGRPEAYMLADNSRISARLSDFFKSFFPHDFSLLITARPRNGNQGTILNIRDKHNRRTILGVHVGVNPMFEYRDHNDQPGLNSPQFYINLSDGRRHQFAFSVRGGSVTMYADCTFEMTRTLRRSSMPQIDGASVVFIGASSSPSVGEQFEGDIEQLILTPDVTAAQQHCSRKKPYNGLTKPSKKEHNSAKKDKKDPHLDNTPPVVPGKSIIQTDEPGSGSEESYDWSTWSLCSTTCGPGIRTRTAYCLDNSLTVDECVDDGKNPVETEKCFEKECKDICTVRCFNGGICEKNKCTCPYGYHGNQCEKARCHLKCLNGGFCMKPYQCACPPQYSGRQCERAVCTPGCKHGSVCVAGVCKCPAGTVPPKCEPACKAKCLNGGTCMNGNRCRCPRGFYGNQCQFSFNYYVNDASGPDCSKGCFNGGRCIGVNKCACRHGYTGESCEKALCSPTCQNGGTCLRPHVCMCKAGTWGAYCQQYSCAQQCKNGGRCDSPNLCRCPIGYSGDNCERKTCSLSCQNGGQCIHGNRCRCQSGYYGRKCEMKQCKYEKVMEPYQRGYNKLMTTNYKTKCGFFGWNTCVKVRKYYQMVYKTFYRPTYKCV